MREAPFEAVRHWIFQSALPFWAESGVDQVDGGFYEELDSEGRPTDCEFKRVRVICRQIYVFSHAAALGWEKGAATADLGYAYLVDRAKLAHGGWARTLTRRGAVADATIDLYDLAFVIFAMAWRYQTTGDQEARAHAIGTLEFVRERMRAPGGGFWETMPTPSTRRQNPHMHLAEACLAAFDATKDEVFLNAVRELVELCIGRFCDARSLGERFDNTWTRVDRVAEPGHHFEWTWILAQYQRLSGENVGAVAARLADFAERHGVDPETRAVYDAIDTEGGVIRHSSRVWTNTERIKAALGLFELEGRDPRPVLASSADLIFGRYFADNLPGLWTDQFDGAGKPMTTTTPASCVYHLFLAFSEMLRLEPQIAKLP